MKTLRAAARALVAASDSVRDLSDTAAACEDWTQAIEELRAAIEQPDAPPTVWIVANEWNENEELDTIGIYSSHQKAMAVQSAAQRQHAREGKDVFAYPETDDNNDFWDVDVHCDEHTIDEIPDYLKKEIQ